MDKQIIELGRAGFKAIATDLKVMHGIELATEYSDKDCFENGQRIIESEKKAEAARVAEGETDRQYLDSLDPEERMYILLKRKYEPCEMGG